jgi:hypothetical protein
MGAAAPSKLRTNEPIYQNPFDLSAGGASLTRATQDGVLFANPSLPAFGGGFLRWIFLRTGFHLGADAVDMAYQYAKGGSTPKLDGALIERALKTPIHLGVDMSLGFVTANIGTGLFVSTRADMEGRQYGSQGLPEFRARAFGYGGAIASSSLAPTDWLALGGSVRYQANGELYKSIGLTEVANADQIASNLQKEVQYGYGLGVDLGMVAQWRSRHVDFRLGATLNDVGDTNFTGQLDSWKETLNVGFGTTLHDRTSAIHCAVDVRDVMMKYGEHWTRRTYAGCKALFRSRAGVAAGLYQGWLTYGAVLNLFIMRLEVGTYQKEVGREVGTQPRRVYYLATGAEIP